MRSAYVFYCRPAEKVNTSASLPGTLLVTPPAPILCLTPTFSCLKWLKHFLGSLFQTLPGTHARQVQWGDERGVVKPEREGHRRMYSMNHLTEVAVICELRRKGFSLQSVRKVMRFLGREFGKGLAEIMSHGSEYHLLPAGTHLYLETSARQIVDILKHSCNP